MQERIKKNMQKLFLNHKNSILIALIVLLLAGITFFISYAYYKDIKIVNIVESKVGTIPTSKVRILVQNANFATYKATLDIPDNNHVFNAKLSYCIKGNALEYNAEEKSFPINSSDVDDICYAYFSYLGDEDIILNVYTKTENSYTLFEGEELPAGYEVSSYECSSNNTELTYEEATKTFTIKTPERVICDAYMDLKS